MKYSSWKLHPNKSIQALLHVSAVANQNLKCCIKGIPVLKMCKSTSYTCGVLSGIEFIGYYFMIIFETSLAKVDLSGSNFLPFSILRAIISQFFILEVMGNTKEIILFCIFGCIFRSIKLGGATYVYFNYLLPQKEYDYFIHYNSYMIDNLMISVLEMQNKKIISFSITFTMWCFLKCHITPSN